MGKLGPRILLGLIFLVLLESYYIINLNNQVEILNRELSITKSDEIIDFEENISINNRYLDGEMKNIDNGDQIDDDCPCVGRTLTLIPFNDLDELTKKYKLNDKNSDNSKKLSKKELFIANVLPVIIENRTKLLATYESLLAIKEQNLTSDEDGEWLRALYSFYEIENGKLDELILAVKPHPISIILAQASLETAWGTSRFFLKSNNIFHVVSTDPNSERRIKTESDDDEVYFKIYESYIDSVDDYMATIARSPLYKIFRKKRHEIDDPFKLVEELGIYSALREEYVRRLKLTIRANNFQKYDNDENINNNIEILYKKGQEIEIE